VAVHAALTSFFFAICSIAERDSSPAPAHDSDRARVSAGWRAASCARLVPPKREAHRVSAAVSPAAALARRLPMLLF
jgi:hypothetical protein